MNQADFSVTLAGLQERCNNALVRLLGHGHSEYSPAAGPLLVRLFEASAYALTRGGKRVRPALVYAAAAAVDRAALDQDDESIPSGLDYVASACEMLHAYSLVHDDLPAMDNDSMRRGQPTCHIAFDEATAILVGDGLQARALELLTDAPDFSAEARLQMVRCLTAAVGNRGMVGGQSIDIAAVDQHIDGEHLETMHALKTGALIRASVALGGIAGRASETQLEALDDYADAIGLAFQVWDDVLDASGDSATLGKQAGADAANHKPNYVSSLGLEAARSKALALRDDAIAALNDFGDSADLLRGLANYIVAREH